MRRTEPIIGEQNNRLTLLMEGISYTSPKGVVNRRFVFRCLCGKNTLCTYNDFKKGHTKSCGCYSRELAAKRQYKHGLAGTLFYDVYSAMIARCNNKSNKDYFNWGGRGIECSWKDFQSFKNDMHGSYLRHIKKYNLTNTRLDRIDNNGNYCKENCKWSTHKEQARNRRNNHLLTFNNKTQTLTEWAEELGINRGTLNNRINRYNWSIKDALTKKTK